MPEITQSLSIRVCTPISSFKFESKIFAITPMQAFLMEYLEYLGFVEQSPITYIRVSHWCCSVLFLDDKI